MSTNSFTSVSDRIELQRRSINDDINPGGILVKLSVPKHIFDMLPPSIVDGVPALVAPVMFTQGINEKQNMAVVFGATTSLQLQQSINRKHLQRMQRYFAKYRAHALEVGVEREYLEDIDFALGRFAAEVATSKLTKKNFGVLMQSSDLARKLGGCRITSCKSAKDRTSMSITHEETRLLPELPREHALQFANVLREFGVRVANCRKNTGKGAYAFNVLQRKLLPVEYRPPVSVSAGGEA
jgi:inositol polyphosphate-4-phosphatase